MHVSVVHMCSKRNEKLVYFNNIHFVRFYSKAMQSKHWKSLNISDVHVCKTILNIEVGT